MSEEELSSLNRMKSRRWLQSTEMEYENEELMERQSRITLRPFELFPPDESGSRQSQVSQMRESNGFLTIESQNFLEENVFPF